MIRQIEDRNYDGVQDTWSDLEWGAVVARVLDSNDDGNPDTWETYEAQVHGTSGPGPAAATPAGRAAV